MKGKILGYSVEDSKGVISADDENRYEFLKEEFKDSLLPKKNMTVDFEIEDGKAKEIYLIKDPVDENKTIMGLVAIILMKKYLEISA
jgi:hypothetical protein